MLVLFQRVMLSATHKEFQILETRVQMLDNTDVNNNFDRELQSNYAKTDLDRSMALELRAGAKITCQGAGTKDC
jgi:hypothetical protein